VSDGTDRPSSVSVAELPGVFDGPGSSPDRTPPQDIAAEQSVLGAMMLSKDAIADVVEVLREGDFYRPAHATIYSAILDLYGKGEPADAVTVSHELTRVGELARVGGAPYLHTLVSMVPTAANAEYYARIVRERAILRRLVEAGTRIVQMGYTGEGEVDDVVDRAQAEVYEVTERRTAEDYLPLRDLMDGALTEIEAISNRGGQMVGVPTGFADLDALTNGLHPGQLVILAARPALGKALALDTPIPTPTGWTTMGEIQPGDFVLGDDGRPTRVRAISEVWRNRPCYRVSFSDGSDIIADAEHEWLTDDGVRAVTRTTGAIARDLQTNGYPTHAVKTCAPIRPLTTTITADPYTEGVLVSGGTSDPEITAWLEPQAQRPTLGAAGLDPLTRAAVEQRRAFLSGVCDCVGEVLDDGWIRVAMPGQVLADRVYETAVSLGYQCSWEPDGEGHCALVLLANDEVFRLPGKALLHKERLAANSTAHIDSRFITSVEPVASVPVKCIEVENESHLYLAGRAMIPTHNSTLGLDIARAASIKHNLTSVIFSLEMSRNEIIMRLLSAEAQVALHHMRAGSMSDADWTKLASKMGVVSEAPLFIDDSPNLTMMEIRAKCRRLKQRHDLRLVIVDYMQLMTSGKKVESRQQEVSEFSRSLKLLAKELDVPVIAISQLNRGPEQRTDKRPMLADLRESGSLEQDADMVILLHREDAYERESPRAGEADFIVAKHRNGPTSTITVAFQGHYSRFVDMAGQ
jgi:replicative DNA helicase